MSNVPAPMAVAGLFLSHTRSDRTERCFARLVEETRRLIDWHFVFNPDHRVMPRVDFPVQPAAAVLPRRFAQMLRNGTIVNGYIDVLSLPCVLALHNEFVWVVEYDVDFSGSWSRLFEQFTDNRADLLGTTLARRAETPGWFHWSRAAAPSGFDEATFCRGFLPIMRLSRRFAEAYRDAMRNRAWRGHYEFTMPTVALAGGFILEDIGGAGAFTPDMRVGLNYANNPLHEHLSPGTLVWRPSRDAYFHEAPERFEQPEKLYHPVKPDVGEWNRQALRRPLVNSLANVSGKLKGAFRRGARGFQRTT